MRHLRMWSLLVMLIMTGCGRSVRELSRQEGWYIVGNLLLVMETGKQQISVEMYGRKGDIWIIEGREPLLSRRVFWFCADVSGTNYIINDIQGTYWFFVDETWSSLFVEVLPTFFEREEKSVGVTNDWPVSNTMNGWMISVRKRFENGMPRIIVIEGYNQRMFLDIQRISRDLYPIQRYEDKPWQQVRIVPEQGFWEVIYE
ncbi:hypothetical protein [Thermospira aquatica]|uniref:Uncharacterized protein n=1 Tax=Thermospira aquatica TaxID=2828656 RepID=A0AAX3BE02_9SPIR|nr:hypothetical protein [Thermospira aquatica]URA10559.1 hypothetical protein KDW03_01790 [Thermospira aquatica]